MPTYVATHWLALACIALSLPPLALALWRLITTVRTTPAPAVLGSALGLFGIGGLEVIAWDHGMYVTLADLGLLVAALVVVLITGVWSAPLGYFLGAVLLFGLGAWSAAWL